MSASSRGRIRPRPVSFGNPALGTYGGCVYILEGNESLPTIPETATSVEKVVAMTDVQPEQVPEGILNLARNHRPYIEHLKIMVSSGESEVSDSTTALMESTESSVDGAPPQELLSSASDDDKPSRNYLILFRLSTQEAADTFVRELHDKPYTSLDETQRCSVYHVVGFQADEGVSLMSPFFAPSASDLGLVAAPSDSSSPRNQPASLEVHNCAVCLERMDLENESLLTTVCNHSFHLDCLMQWQDSPCPVCRYDHSGLNEALSRCHVCGTTENNYVCLICGVVSCGGGAARASTRTTAEDATTLCTSSESAAISNANDRHNSSTGVSPPLSHARQHYDETLHAYALDTETQHVWDFCGQGYVHRLLQNAKDDKLVEVNDPNNTSAERTLSPGLSDLQEGEVVHRKLEGFASQYYTLLKSQLEQQRIYYEGRLEEIRREHGRPRKKSASPSADLISALKQERNQLMQRCQTLRQKHEKVAEDIVFLRNMNESLKENKGSMKQKIMEAQRERAEAKDMIQKCMPPLEEKLRKLMLQLEESIIIEESAEQAPSQSSADDRKPAAKR